MDDRVMVLVVGMVIIVMPVAIGVVMFVAMLARVRLVMFAAMPFMVFAMVLIAVHIMMLAVVIAFVMRFVMVLFVMTFVVFFAMALVLGLGMRFMAPVRLTVTERDVAEHYNHANSHNRYKDVARNSHGIPLVHNSFFWTASIVRPIRLRPRQACPDRGGLPQT
jgi:hypothetical protein